MRARCTQSIHGDVANGAREHILERIWTTLGP
jgi:hypothetical protein